MRQKKNCSRNAGITFLEITIAIALGLILLSAIFHLYKNSKKVFVKDVEVIELERNMILAAAILTKNIRMAGYAGCAKMSEVQKMGNYRVHSPLPCDYPWDKNLYGFSSATAPSFLQGKMVVKSDGVLIRKADSATTALKEDILSPASSVQVLRNPTNESNRMVLLSDCDHADLFWVANSVGLSLKLTGDSKIFHGYQKKDSEISRFTEVIYFISKSSRADEKGKPILGLYTITNRGKKEELISFVSDMKIRYVIGSDRYLAYEVSRLNLWDKVKALTIDLTFTHPKINYRVLHLYIKLRNN